MGEAQNCLRQKGLPTSEVQEKEGRVQKSRDNAQEQMTSGWAPM